MADISPELKNIGLIPRANLNEDSLYYVGFGVSAVQDVPEIMALTGKDYIDMSFMVKATRSKLAAPATISWIGDPSTTPAHNYANLDRLAQYYRADLRLNIYSATWESLEYTDFIKDKYMGDILLPRDDFSPKVLQELMEFHRY